MRLLIWQRGREGDGHCQCPDRQIALDAVADGLADDAPRMQVEDEALKDGRARLVRDGHLPECEVMTGIGPVPVKVPRVRDRRAVGPECQGPVRQDRHAT